MKHPKTPNAEAERLSAPGKTFAQQLCGQYGLIPVGEPSSSEQPDAAPILLRRPSDGALLTFQPVGIVLHDIGRYGFFLAPPELGLEPGELLILREGDAFPGDAEAERQAVAEVLAQLTGGLPTSDPDTASPEDPDEDTDEGSILTLQDEAGNDVPFRLLTRIPVEDSDYAVLEPLPGYGFAEDEVVILRMEQQGGQTVLSAEDDPERLQQVMERLNG